MMPLNNYMHDRDIALADCNNFFVSCERRVAPDFDKLPMVVLSCNDGCVISRSNEVKRMGVRMGDPYFKIRNMLAFNGVVVRSTNMRLYQKISAEVMNRIKLYTDEIEIYSIDEAFFCMGISNISDPVSYCRRIREDIWKQCRIPVSIGIAPTKTLCKLGTEYAKKNTCTCGVFWMDKSHYMDMTFMSQFECKDIWGIGRRIGAKLEQFRIKNVVDFIRKDEMWIKKTFGILTLYTAWELKGHTVHALFSGRKPPKSIMVSRSFGNPVTKYADLLDPLLCFTASAARQLRKAKQKAGKMAIYISTNRFDQEKYYANGKEISFKEHKFLDADLMASAEAMLREIFIEGYEYKKCGVLLSDFSDTSAGTQTTLFIEAGDVIDRQTRAAATIDNINSEYRQSLIKPAVLFNSPDDEKKWMPKSEFNSVGKKIKDSPLPHGLLFQSHSEDCL